MDLADKRRDEQFTRIFEYLFLLLFYPLHRPRPTSACQAGAEQRPQKVF